MKKKRDYPKGCTDLGMAFDAIDKAQKEKRRKEYMENLKKERN